MSTRQPNRGVHALIGRQASTKLHRPRALALNDGRRRHQDPPQRSEQESPSPFRGPILHPHRVRAGTDQQSAKQIIRVEEGLRLSIQRGELEIVEIHVPVNSPAIGIPVKNLSLPVESNLICLIRGEEINFPRGDTSFRANDTVVALTSTKRVDELKKVFYP